MSFTITFKLGKKGVVAVVLFLGFVIFCSRPYEPEGDLREAVQAYLSREQVREAVPALASALKNSDDAQAEKLGKYLTTDEVRIEAISARGPLWPAISQEAIVRVRYCHVRGGETIRDGDRVLRFAASLAPPGTTSGTLLSSLTTYIRFSGLGDPADRAT